MDFDDNFKVADQFDLCPYPPESSSNSSDSSGGDFCMNSTLYQHDSSTFRDSQYADAQDFPPQSNYSSKKTTKKHNTKQNKPRRKRQNITRRPGETDAQLKERRYQAKLKRNRESGKRARKRRKDAFGELKLEEELLLQQLHAKRLILNRLEQQNAQLKQELISERAANHPIFNHNSPRARARRSQEPQAPPLTMFAVGFVALLTWTATLESSSLYSTHNYATKGTVGAKVFSNGAPASLSTPAVALALESLLEYTLLVQHEYWHACKAFVQLMIIFVLSLCFLGFYSPSMGWSKPRMRARCSRVRCRRMRSSNRSRRVSFTSSSSKTDTVRGIKHTHRRVITYII